MEDDLTIKELRETESPKRVKRLFDEVEGPHSYSNTKRVRVECSDLASSNGSHHTHSTDDESLGISVLPDELLYYIFTFLDEESLLT